MPDEFDRDELSETDPPTSTEWTLVGRRVAFLGKLGGFTRREMPLWVREHGAMPVDASDPTADLVVIGADELPLGEGELLDRKLESRAAAGELEIISETDLWQRLGWVESDQDVRRLYTPAMLAELLHLPVTTIRRWHRRGLIQPVREVLRLPYFDFQEVATARRLAQLVAAGVSVASLERKLNDLARLVPGVQRPLAQLSVIVQGGELLLRRPEGLIEPGGQRRIDFDSHDDPGTGSNDTIASFAAPDEEPVSAVAMVDMAQRFEDEGRLGEAAELYRAAMAADGPQAEWCFHLAELLYRSGEIVAARERYYMAIELDENYLEARANLGCILAETRQFDLAIAAFEGALRFHPHYPDAHYHLAKLYDEQGAHDRAERHWQQFLQLAPDSPWADEARIRLDEGL